MQLFRGPLESAPTKAVSGRKASLWPLRSKKSEALPGNGITRAAASLPFVKIIKITFIIQFLIRVSATKYYCIILYSLLPLRYRAITFWVPQPESQKTRKKGRVRKQQERKNEEMKATFRESPPIARLLLPALEWPIKATFEPRVHVDWDSKQCTQPGT